MFGDLVNELEGLGEAGLADRLHVLELQRRQVEAAIATVVDITARRGEFRADGHRSVRGWLKAHINCSDADATRFVRLGQLIRDVPEAGERLHDGDVGIAQAGELVRARKNPRCGDQLPEAAPLLLGHAASLPFADFKQCVRRFRSGRFRSGQISCDRLPRGRIFNDYVETSELRNSQPFDGRKCRRNPGLVEAPSLPGGPPTGSPRLR
jgi:Domain of unknown function (DUF222)